MSYSIRVQSLLLLAGVASAGCEPATVTEAVNQLGRGGERISEYALPVVRDTFRVESLLDSSVVVVTPDSLLGIRLDSRNLVYGVGFFAPFVSFGDSVPIVAFQEIVQDDASDQLDFGELEEAVPEVVFNDARLILSLDNTSDVDAILVDFNLGAAELDAGGQLPAPLVYQPLGSPILIPVAEPGTNSLRIAANTDTSFTIQGGSLVNELVHMVFDRRRTALVGEGVLTTDATAGQIDASDVITVQTELVAVIDFTVPDTGLVFTVNTTRDGLGVDTDETSTLLARLDRADVLSDVLNSLPFGTELDIAIAPGDLGEDDVFAHPDAVVLARIVVDTSVVDASGKLSSAQLTTAALSLVGEEARALLSEQFTASIRVRLMGAATSARRGAVRAGTAVAIKSEARIRLRLGASQ
jgi:hypothetical protein